MLLGFINGFVDALQKTRQGISKIAPTTVTRDSVPSGKRVEGPMGPQLEYQEKMLFISKADQFSALHIRYGTDFATQRPEDLNRLIQRFTYNDLKADPTEDEVVDHFFMLLIKVEILLRYSSKRSFDNANYYGRVFNAMIMFESFLVSKFLEKLFAFNLAYQTVLIDNNLITLFQTLREGLIVQPRFRQVYLTPLITSTSDLKYFLTQFYSLVQTGRIAVPQNPDTKNYDYIDFTLSKSWWPCVPKPPSHNIQYRDSSSKGDAAAQANRKLWLFLQYCNPANTELDFYTVYAVLLQTIALFAISKNLNAKTKPIVNALVTLYCQLKLYIECNEVRKNDYIKQINCTGELRKAAHVAAMPLSVSPPRPSLSIAESDKCTEHPEHLSSGVPIMRCDKHPSIVLMRCCVILTPGMEIANSQTWCALCKDNVVQHRARPVTVFNPSFRETAWLEPRYLEEGMEQSEI